MPGLSASLKAGLGSGFANTLGRGTNPTEAAMYPPGYGSGGKTPAHVITGELLFLVALELVLLGVIRVSFKHHFGG